MYSECPPLIGATIGMIAIADRLSTPPGSPTPGARYILTSSPTGAWSTFAEHDIAEATGFGGWIRYTPAASCGWRAFVQDEGIFYAFRKTAWAADDQDFSVRGLVIIQNSGTPTTQLDIACDDAFIGIRTGAIAATLNAASTGANGLDTGSLANSTWYYVFLISNGATMATLLSTSATAPTMPSGYIYKYRVGAVRTGGSATFLRTTQKGNTAQYTPVSGSTVTAFPVMLAASAGSFPQTITLSSFVSPTAIRVRGYVTAGSTIGSASIAANNFSGAETLALSTSTSNTQVASFFDLVIEGASIFGKTSASSEVRCHGWVDSVNAS
jgi:hypothetical protein